MAYLSLSQSFLVIVSKLAVNLQPASPLSPPFSPLHQHLASLQPTIILALILLLTEPVPAAKLALCARKLSQLPTGDLGCSALHSYRGLVEQSTPPFASCNGNGFVEEVQCIACETSESGMSS